MVLSCYWFDAADLALPGVLPSPLLGGRPFPLHPEDHLHGNPHHFPVRALDAEAAGFQGLTDEDRAAVHQVGEMPVTPLEGVQDGAALALLGNSDDNEPSAGLQDALAFGQDFADLRR